MATPREVAEALAKRLSSEYEGWYERHGRRCYRWYVVLQTLAFVSGLSAALIAALLDVTAFGGWGKYALIVLPIVASLSTSLVTQLRLYDLWKLREEGRLQFQDLAIEAERRAAAAASDAELNALNEELQQKIRGIESAQSGTFFGMFGPSFVIRVEKLQ